MAFFYKRYYLNSKGYRLLADSGYSRAEIEEGLSKASETVEGWLRIPVGGKMYKVFPGEWGSWSAYARDKRILRLSDPTRRRLILAGISLQDIRKAEAERTLCINLRLRRTQYLLDFGDTFRPLITDPREDWVFEEDNDGEKQ